MISRASLLRASLTTDFAPRLNPYAAARRIDKRKGARAEASISLPAPRFSLASAAFFHPPQADPRITLKKLLIRRRQILVHEHVGLRVPGRCPKLVLDAVIESPDDVLFEVTGAGMRARHRAALGRCCRRKRLERSGQSAGNDQRDVT